MVPTVTYWQSGFLTPRSPLLKPAIWLALFFLVRNHVVAKPSWLAVIVVSICLAFSALYELIVWWVALLSAEAAESFLGTQGYVWDTQSDMFLALLGAVLALLTLSRIHDRQIRALSV